MSNVYELNTNRIHLEQEKMDKIVNLTTVLQESLASFSGKEQDRREIVEKIKKLKSQLEVLEEHLKIPEVKAA